MNRAASIERLLDRPVLVAPGRARALLAAALSPRADAEPYELGDRRALRHVTVEGVAVIPVHGPLTQRPDWWIGGTAYGDLRAAIGIALLDPEVRAVALDIDSPGGEVAGCFDLCDWIAAQSEREGGSKPIVAVLDECAYSAAYAIAAACDRVTAPRTGGAGSIGVVVMHAEFSGALEKAGIAVTLIHAGARKVDGNPFAPLPDEVRTRIQADCDEVRALFVDYVARCRGLDPKDVAATEAAALNAPDALASGLIDAIAAPDAALAALARAVVTTR